MSWETYLQQLHPNIIAAFVAGLTVGIAARWAVKALAVVAGLWLIFEMLKEAGAV